MFFSLLFSRRNFERVLQSLLFFVASEFSRQYLGSVVVLRSERRSRLGRKHQQILKIEKTNLGHSQINPSPGVIVFFLVFSRRNFERVL